MDAHSYVHMTHKYYMRVWIHTSNYGLVKHMELKSILIVMYTMSVQIQVVE